MPLSPRRLLPDTAPRRSSRAFRLLWGTGAVTVLGSFLTFVALPLQLKKPTGSAATVGAQHRAPCPRPERRHVDG